LAADLAGAVLAFTALVGAFLAAFLAGFADTVGSPLADFFGVTSGAWLETLLAGADFRTARVFLARTDLSSASTSAAERLRADLRSRSMS